MKITRAQLKQIIKEELKQILSESDPETAEPWPDPGTPEWDERMETVPQWGDEYTDQMNRLRNQELGVEAGEEPPQFCGPFGCPSDDEEAEEENIVSR